MQIEYRDLGTMEYEACWQLQQELFDALLARKRASERTADEKAGTLLLVEHLPYPLQVAMNQNARKLPMVE